MNAGPQKVFAMDPTIPLPPRYAQHALTPLAQIIVELDVVAFQWLTERRFLVRSLIPGEFDTELMAGDANQRPQQANAVIIDRTKPRVRVVTYIGDDEPWPNTDREILALMRRWGCAI